MEQRARTVVGRPRRSTGSAYRPALDGLRAVAVLMVFCRHTGLRAVLPPGIGALGVGIFFALSGFLITRLLLDERERSGATALGAFYLRRARRLLPALVVMLLVVTAVALPLGDSRTVHGALAALLYAANWTNIADWTAESGVGHAWSLAIEEHFYLVWPVLFVLLVRRLSLTRAALATLLLCAVAIAWRLHLQVEGASALRLQQGSDTRADALLIGCAVALLSVAHGYRPPPWAVGVAWPLLLGVSLLDPRSAPVLSVGVTLVAVATCVLVLDAWEGRGLHARLLSWPPLVALGAVSYGFYLWHFPVAYLAGRLPGPAAAHVLPVLVVSLGLTALSARYVERPFLGRPLVVPGILTALRAMPSHAAVRPVATRSV